MDLRRDGRALAVEATAPRLASKMPEFLAYSRPCQPCPSNRHERARSHAVTYTVMPDLITLFEHETSTVKCTDELLRELERLDRAGRVSMLRTAVRGGKVVLQATQHVGVMRLGHQTIQVLPKIYSSQSRPDRRASEAIRNILVMLSYAGGFGVNERGLAALTSYHADWFEILTKLFCSHLEHEWLRGPYRTYQEIEADLPVLKGRLQVLGTLRRPERKDRFVVTHDAFTVDNQLNRVLRFVVERLWLVTSDPENKRRLTNLRGLMDDVTLLPTVTTQAIPIDRTSCRYELLLTLARVFLTHMTLQLSAGAVQTFTFSVDMHVLFESFLTGFIQRNRDAILSPYLAQCSFLPQTRGATLYLARAGLHPVFHLRPDIAFRDASGCPLCIDAKYKRLDAADRSLGVAQSDFYQMYAYARRYDCPRVLLIYPQAAETGGAMRRRFNLEPDFGVIDVATIDLQVDLTAPAGRAAFVSQLKEVVAMEEMGGAS